MANILFDTNILLDVILRRPEAEAAYSSLASAILKGDTLYVSANSMPDIFYVVRKAASEETAAAAVDTIMSFMKIADVTAVDIRNAAASGMPDFEDAVIASVAQRIGADHIVTRNVKDFADSPVRAVHP